MIVNMAIRIPNSLHCDNHLKIHCFTVTYPVRSEEPVDYYLQLTDEQTSSVCDAGCSYFCKVQIFSPLAFLRPALDSTVMSEEPSHILLWKLKVRSIYFTPLKQYFLP